MDDVLKELGWGDGFRIPVANEENKALEEEIQKKQKEKDHLKTSLETITDRVASMKKHLGNVHHQLDINQNLIFAHTNQKAAEENLAKLARVEDSTLTNEIKKIKKEQSDVQERLNKVQADVNRVLQRVERLNSTIKWDKDALLAWDEEVSRGDDDTQMLEKFCREDEAKFKELELKRQYMGVEVENKRNRLLSLKNDILSMEQSLDKTAQTFRRHHNDRMMLVQQWEGSVRVLYQRDEDINRVMEEIANLRLLAKERLKDLEEKKAFFENEKTNNEEVEKEIGNLLSQTSSTKEKINTLETLLSEDNNQLTLFKTILSTTTTELHKIRNQIKSNVKEIQTKDESMVEMVTKVGKFEEDYQKCKNKTMSASERVQQLEEILKEEEKQMEKNAVALKKLDELLFQVTHQIKELTEGAKTQESSIHRYQTMKLTFHKHIAKAKTELNRQKELLYNIDFAYMEKDIQLRKLLGEETGEDSEKYEKKISELEQSHSKLTATYTLLTKEVQRLDEEMRRINVEKQLDAKEQEYLRNKRQEKILMIDGGQKQLNALRLRNQDSQVDENVLKLRVRQAEKEIDKVGGKVFCLEKQRLELEEVMKEREVEIKALRDILTVRKRVLIEQAANLNSRINLAKVKVEHMKNKYEVAVSKLGKDESGEPLSVTQLKVKSAQERMELQQTGDELDSKIKKTEKEIEAMENTLKIVNATNKAFRNNLQSMDPQCPEFKEKEELEKLHAELIAEYRKKKAILDGLSVITMDLKDEFQDKLRIEAEILESWKEKDQQAAETDKELKEQEEKLVRAEKQLRRLIKVIRGTTKLKFQTEEEKDVELRELMEQNEYGLQQLAELVAKTYDTGPVVMQYLADKGLRLPMLKSPAPSLKCPSTASLPSSRRTSESSKSRESLKSSKSFSSNTIKSLSCACSPTIISLDYPNLSESTGQKSGTMDRILQQPCKSIKKASESDVKKKGSH